MVNKEKEALTRSLSPRLPQSLSRINSNTRHFVGAESQHPLETDSKSTAFEVTPLSNALLDSQQACFEITPLTCAIMVALVTPAETWRLLRKITDSFLEPAQLPGGSQEWDKRPDVCTLCLFHLQPLSTHCLALPVVWLIVWKGFVQDYSPEWTCHMACQSKHAIFSPPVFQHLLSLSLLQGSDKTRRSGYLCNILTFLIVWLHIFSTRRV